MFTSWFIPNKNSNNSPTILDDIEEDISPLKLPIPPIPPLPEDYVYLTELPPLKYGMPLLPKPAPLLPMLKLPKDYIFKPGLPPLKYGMPPLPKIEDTDKEKNEEIINKELNEYYVKTSLGNGKITKFRDDDMLEIDLFWNLTDNKPVKQIIHKNKVEHIPKPVELPEELLDEITPLSDTENNNSLEYSDSDSDSSLELQLFPISKLTQRLSEANLYLLGGLYLSTIYLVSVSLLRHLLC